MLQVGALLFSKGIILLCWHMVIICKNLNQVMILLMIYCALHQVEEPDTFTWLHMHQTWLDGFGIEDAKRWFF